MNAATIRDLLTQQPFRPFFVHLSNGETYEVRHPEFAIVLKSTLVIGYPDSDRIAIASMIHINNIDFPDLAVMSA
jgi:hypothetical protein